MPADPPPPTLRFADHAVLVLPEEVTDCAGAVVLGDRGRQGQAHVLCSFCPGEIVHRVHAPLPPGLHVTAILVLAPADARALARELERAAEEAEEQ
jgi:hypothetical protein